jgi:hypothetical protein
MNTYLPVALIEDASCLRCVPALLQATDLYICPTSALPFSLSKQRVIRDQQYRLYLRFSFHLHASKIMVSMHILLPSTQLVHYNALCSMQCVSSAVTNTRSDTTDTPSHTYEYIL